MSEPITQKAAVDMSARPHGFMFPQSLPACAQCGLPANDPSHVNPAKGGVNHLMGGSASGDGIRLLSADMGGLATGRRMTQPRRSHAYSSGSTAFNQIPCVACGQSMGASCHTPGMPSGMGYGTEARGVQVAAEGDGNEVIVSPGTGAGPKEGYGEIVLQRHPFQALEGLNSVDAAYKLCALCGYAADDEVHQNTGDGDADTNFVTVKRLEAREREPEVTLPTPVRTVAFVTQLGDKTILTAPASVFSQPGDDMPRELAAAWEKASAQNPHFLWIEGRYVEADRPNRNKAAWSTQDLEMGEPTVPHGPLNWLHEERHIIGTIAAAKLVLVGDGDRQAAAAMGVEPPNTHIRTLAPVWRYLYPTEARQIAHASDERKLWQSMECVSREVACLQPGCSHTQAYGEYMLQPQTRCAHVKQGGNRQFKDPSFLGGAVILGGLRPGWSGANASVMRQAAMHIEGQEASLTGLSEEEAVTMVAQIVQYANATGGT
jgi:hypothetical protein